MHKTLLKFPVFFGSLRRLLNGTALLVAIINPIAFIVSVHEVGPSDNACDNEQLRSEMEPATIEGLDGGNHGFTRLDQQLIALKM